MKILAKILAVFCIATFAYAQTVQIPADAAPGADFVSALAFANGGGAADTLELTTDGGVYELSEGDTISVPLTIRAAAGLAN